MFKVLLLIFTILPFITHATYTQFLRGGSKIIIGNEELFLEAVKFSSNDRNEGKIFVNYRITENFFIYVKDTTNIMTAAGEILIEIFENSNSIVRSEIIKHELTKKPGEQNLTDKYITGSVIFNTPHGEYKIRAELRDEQSSRKLIKELPDKFTIRKITGDIITSSLFLLKPFNFDNPDTQTIEPVNFGGNAEFGKDFFAYVELYGNFSDTNFTVNHKLIQKKTSTTIDSTEAGIKIFNSYTINPVNWIENNGTVQQNVDYRFVKKNRTRSLIFQIPAVRMKTGEYSLELNIYSNKIPKTFVFDFKMEWLNKPKSLINLLEAIDILDYIATKEEMKEIKSGSSEKKLNNFEKFWEKRDPSPETAFNELMFEYYKRVDEATKFNSIRNPNGARTERGKIYILYGQPDNTERIFSPSASSREIWDFFNLNKRFVFEDKQNNSDYKLIKIEEL